MPEVAEPLVPAELQGNSARRFWLGVLTAFPFLFLPLTALVCVLASWLSPWVRSWLY